MDRRRYLGMWQGATPCPQVPETTTKNGVRALDEVSKHGSVSPAGPHPEATDDWFSEAHVPLAPPGGHAPARDLAFDLVETTMQ